MYVYFIQAGENGAVKIGVANNVENRLEQLQTGNHLKLTILKKIKCLSKCNSYSVESELHHKFRKYRIRGEWFKSEILKGEFETKEHKKLKEAAIIGTKNQSSMDKIDRNWAKFKKENKRKIKRCKSCNVPVKIGEIKGVDRIENIYGGKHDCVKHAKRGGITA